MNYGDKCKTCGCILRPETPCDFGYCGDLLAEHGLKPVSEDKEEPKSGAEAYVSRTAALEARIEELEEEENAEAARFEEERDEWVTHARDLREKLEAANELIATANEACDLMGGATNNMDQIEIPDAPD